MVAFIVTIQRYALHRRATKDSHDNFQNGNRKCHKIIRDCVFGKKQQQMKFHIEMDKVHEASEEQVADTADDQPFSPNHESWL